MQPQPKNFDIENQDYSSSSAEVQLEGMRHDGGTVEESTLPPFALVPYPKKLALDGWELHQRQLEDVPPEEEAKLVHNGVQVANSLQRIRKLEDKHRLNLAVGAKIDPLYHHLSVSIASCSTVIERYEFSDGSDLLHSLKYCGKRFCAICAERRSRRLVRKYAPVIEEFKKGRYGQHIVLTFPSSQELPSRALISRKIRSLCRRKFWEVFGGVAGGFYSVEATLNRDTGLFHPHVHLLLFTNKPVPCYRRDKNKRQFWMVETNQALRDEWSSIMKGSAFIVRGQRWDGRIYEMLKYMAKQSDILKLNDSQLKHFIEWTAHTRTVSAFGGLYGKLSQVDEDELETEADIDGEAFPPEIPEKRRLIRTTRLRYDDRLCSFVPVSVEEFPPSSSP